MDEELLSKLSCRSGSQLNELPHKIANELNKKLNSGSGCALIAERINEVYECRIPPNISAETLILELADRNIPVGLFATLLDDLELYEPLSALLKPENLVILNEPGNGLERQECELDGTLCLTCVAKGIPLPDIKWWQDNSEISSITDSDFEIKSHCSDTTMTSTLVIRNFSPDHEGKYFCIVSHDSPQFESIRSVEVDVCVKFSKPVIIEEPENACVFEPAPILLSCAAKGYPMPEYQWYFNNLKLFDQRESKLKIGTSIPTKHTGKYKCVATNAVGFVESREVTVNVPEQILKTIEPRKRLKAVEKVALLIANEEGELKKPINDVVLLAQKLENVGFKTLPLINLDYKDMINVINSFSQLLGPGVYGLFYYAGHGCQRGSEILIPPYKASDESAVKYFCCDAASKCKNESNNLENGTQLESVNFTKPKWITDTYILEKMLKNQPKMRIVILDMCLKYSGCETCEFPVQKPELSEEPDLNYIRVCATSKNLSAYECASRPNSNYMTELSKYIDPDKPYTITSIFHEVNRAISKREAKVPLEKDRQIPTFATNIYEDFTLLDPVTGDKHISDYFKRVWPLQKEEIFEFENGEGNIVLKATVKYKQYKKRILNFLVLTFEGIDFEKWKLEILTDRVILQMLKEEYEIATTDQPNKFVIKRIQRHISGINLTVKLREKSCNDLVGYHNLFIKAIDL